MTADLNLSCSLDLGRVNFSDFIHENTTPLWITLFIEIIHWLSNNKKHKKTPTQTIDL